MRLSDKAKYTSNVSTIHPESNVIWRKSSFTPAINCHDWNVRPAALYKDLPSDWGIMRCFRVYTRREEQAVTARSCHCHASDLSGFRKSANIMRCEGLWALWFWHPHTFYGQGCQLDTAFMCTNVTLLFILFIYCTPKTRCHSMGGLLCLLWFSFASFLDFQVSNDAYKSVRNERKCQHRLIGP